MPAWRRRRRARRARAHAQRLKTRSAFPRISLFDSHRTHVFSAPQTCARRMAYCTQFRCFATLLQVLNHTFDILGAFSKLKIEAPLTASKVRPRPSIPRLSPRLDKKSLEATTSVKTKRD